MVKFAAFIHAAILSRDRGLSDPGLQAFHSFIVTLLNFAEYGLKIGLSGERKTWSR